MRVCVVFSLILFLSACSERPLLPMGLGSLGLGRAQPQSDRAATKPDGLRAVGGQVAGADLPRTGVPATGGDGEKTVSLSFSDTDIRDVAQTILGSILGVTFTIDPSIQGTVSLAGNSPVPREEVVPTLETLLGQVNAALIVSNGLYQIVPAERAASQGGLLGPKDDGSGTEILVLRVGSARRIAEMLAPFVPQATRLSPEANRNALLVTGPRAARRSLIDLVRVFDTDVAANTHFVLLEVRRGTPAKAATDLSKALGAGQDGMLSDVVRVLPIEQSGAILVTSANRKLVDRAAALFRRMDGMASLRERTMHVYYVQNGDVSDLLPTLRGAFNLAVEGESRGAGTTVPGQATADLSAPASPPDSRPKQQGATRGSGQGLAASAPASNDELQDPEGLAQGSPNPGGSSGENRMRILSSKRNNALLVYATEAEYQQVYGVLRRIDIRSAQVLIEATIAEVTLNDELQFGTKAYFQTKWGSISLNEKITASGGVFSIKQASPSFAIEALQGVTKVKILSAPQLMVMDNEKARLQVGTTVPNSDPGRSIDDHGGRAGHQFDRVPGYRRCAGDHAAGCRERACNARPAADRQFGRPDDVLDDQFADLRRASREEQDRGG